MDYAVIDVGSNTMRLCIYRVEDGKISTMIRQKEVAGLAGYIKNKQLAQEGIRKACSILDDFRQIAERFVDVRDICVFATASLRGIANQQEVLDTIQLETGLRPQVLLGDEEAQLSLTGALHFSHCTDGIMIDIGGASTEVVSFKNGEPVRVGSVPIGCLSLYADFVGRVIPTDRERKKIKKEIRTQFSKHLNWDKSDNHKLMLAVGGTARAAHKLSRELFVGLHDASSIDVGHVRKILRMLENNTDNIFMAVCRQIPERTHTITTGLMILQEAIKRYGCEHLVVSDYGVREGYLIGCVLNGNAH